MKSRTIEKVIRAKVNNWCKSIIEDKDSTFDETYRKQLVEDIKKHYIVTGGAIVSLLQNEQPNDYDIYFDDADFCLELTRYYVKKIRPDDNTIKSYLDKDDEFRIRAVDREQGMMKPAEKPEKGTYSPVCITENAVTLCDGIQFITRFTGLPEEIHKNYDFIHVTNYMTEEQGLALNKDALISIMSKELKYIGSKYPLSSIIRTRKFIRRGWTCGASEFLKMIYDVSKLDLENYDVLRDQLIGVDVAHFNNLIAALKSRSKPEFAEYRPYFFDLIDEIFASSDPSHEEFIDKDEE